MVKNCPVNAGDTKRGVHSLGQEDPLEEEMATHSSNLAWRIPWTQAWWAIIHGVAKCWKQLRQLSMHALTHVYKLRRAKMH